MDSTNVEKGKIFVGGLSWETKKEGLRAHFERFGAVLDSVIMMDPQSKNPRGFGFVTFRDPSSVQVVMENGPHIIDKKKVDPKPAIIKPDAGLPSSVRGGVSSTLPTKVFVGGIQQGTTEDDVKAVFSNYGNVTDVDLKYDRTTERMRGFGFVGFDNEESVNKVCMEHYISLGNKQVEVKRAEPRQASGQHGASSDRPSIYPGGGYGGYATASSATGYYGGYSGFYGTGQQSQPYAQYGYGAGGYPGQYNQSTPYSGGEHTSYYGTQQSSTGGQQQMTYGAHSAYNRGSMDSYSHTTPSKYSYDHQGQLGSAPYPQYSDSQPANYGQDTRGVGPYAAWPINTNHSN